MLEQFGLAYRVRVYLSESDSVNHQPVHLAIISLLQREGCAGVTVVRGVEGFGAHGRIHGGKVVDMMSELPLILEWIDTPDRVERVLPRIIEQVDGLVTVEDVRVAKHPTRAVRQVPTGVRVRDVMTPSSRVQTATTRMPIREVISLMLRERRNAIPVLDDSRRVVGIITNRDLVERAGLPLRLELLRELGEPESPRVRDRLASLDAGDDTAESIMSTSVVTARADDALVDTARIMLQRQLKRLPVVDEDNHLVGMVSRFDVLRCVRDGYTADSGPEPHPAGRRRGPVRTIGEIMNPQVPTVQPDAPLPDVLDAVMATRLHRAVVVDERRVPIGMVVDIDLIGRVTPDEETSVFGALMQRLRSAGSPGSRQVRRNGLCADDVMRSRDDITIVREGDPIKDVTERSLSEGSKLIVVVDDAGKLVGMVDRADLLSGLMATHQEEPSSPDRRTV